MMKIRYKLFISLATTFATIPLLIYFITFHHPLSSNPQDWAAFGSYLGGVYSSLFGFLSVLVLVATLVEMRNANRQEREHFELQLANAEADKKLQDVIQLTEMIHKLIDVNPTIGDKKQLPRDLAAMMEGMCRRLKVSDEQELYEAGIELMRNQSERFSSEIHVLAQLAKKVDSIKDEDQAETAKAIVKGLISESYRFWLYCYAQVWNLEAKHYLRSWNNFDSIPAELQRYIPDPRDYE
ncbi:hypothetical protein AB6896_21620 [Rahnella inusitata]|jgi:hypothetical protein|uniref:hypothetical protein n=1 Tax=Rahnella inusitata TaxID=58169 RepID=UPI0039BE2B34